MPPKKSKKTSKPKKVNQQEQDDTKYKLLRENIEAQCQSENIRLHSNLEAKLKTMTAEFQLALTQIPMELRQMKMCDVLQLVLRQEEEEEEGAKANAGDDGSDSEMDISIAQTHKQRVRCNSTGSAVKAKPTRSALKAPSMKKAESTGCLTEKSKKSGKKASTEAKPSEIYYTPLAGKKKITNITPKVDLSKPLARSSMRKPLPGELLLSLSGSPIDLSSLLGSRNIKEKIDKPKWNTNTTIAELQKAGDMLKETLPK